MEQGLIDIRNKAREKSKKFGKWSPYEISCETLIAILDELEAAQQSVQADVTTPFCKCVNPVFELVEKCLVCEKPPRH